MRIAPWRHDERARVQAQLIVALVGVAILMIAGFFGGQLSGPHILPDLDLTVYTFTSEQRVWYWSVLWALGFGFTGAALLLAVADIDQMFGTSPPRRKPSKFRILLGLLMVVALPALFAWAAAFSRHEGATRYHCINNLKTIARALNSYHDEFGCLPPAYVPDENGRPKHSWRVLIMPYLEQAGFAGTVELKQLYDSYDFSEPWDGPHNREFAHRMPVVYGCGGDPGRRASNTSYLFLTGKHSAFQNGRPLKLGDISDGAPSTIIIVESANSGVNWMEPKDYPADQLRFGSRTTHNWRIGGNHQGGANAGFADGGVHFLRESEVTNETLTALSTIDGGEKIDPHRW
jgi:prepilin-type processing-associated H-X9-DG protein